MATGLIDIDQILANAMLRMKHGKGAQGVPAAPSFASAAEFDWEDINARVEVFGHAYSHCTHQSAAPAPASESLPDAVAGDMAAAACDAWPHATCGTCVHFRGSIPPSVRKPKMQEQQQPWPEHFGLCENAKQAKLDHSVRRQPIGAAIWAGRKDCKGYSPIVPIRKLRLARQKSKP